MVFKSLLVAFAIPAICTAAAIPQDQEFPEDSIVGGTSARAGDVPFIVSIQLGGRHFCGGSLLNANTVLTAAHCAEGQTASTLQVRAGSLSRSSGGTVVGVSSIVINPSYNTKTYNNDVAIMRLSTPIPTSSTISYATLAAQGSDPADGSITTVAGWGTLSSGGSTSPTNLLKVDVPVISRPKCLNLYPGRVTDNMFCAGFSEGGKDSCQGDSGGPIISTSKVLLGVVSWGDGCAAAQKPGVYARVGTLRPWIEAQL